MHRKLRGLGLSQRDVVHLLELSWQWGWASWQAGKCYEEIREHMRPKTLARIEVRASCPVKGAACCQLDGAGLAVGLGQLAGIGSYEEIQEHVRPKTLACIEMLPNLCEHA